MQNNSEILINIDDIGGLEFLRKNGEEYIPYTIFYIFGVLIGCTGNLLIMTAIIITKELHNSTAMMIFNLSLADILISSFVDGFTIVGIFLGKKWFDNVSILCHFIAALCLIACATSVVNIGFLALNRYINICHHQLYSKLFTTKKTLIYCLITWFIGFLVDLPNIVGWGGHAYDTATLSCLWDRKASHGYTLFFPLTTIVFPCICVLIFYVKIFMFVRNSKKKINPSINNGKKNNNQSQIQIAKGLFSTFTLFTICWLPYGIVVMSDWYHTHPAASVMYTLLIAHLNSAFNPILYAVYNPGFRRGYNNVINLILRHKLKLDVRQGSKELSLSITLNNSTKQPRINYIS